MTEAEATARVEMGLHVVLTAYGLSLLKGDRSEAAFRDNIAVVTRWYRERSDSIQALMHDEPLYNSMRVMGRDPRSLDRDHDEVWEAYWKAYDEISEETLRRDGAHWNALIDESARAVTAGRDPTRRGSRPGRVTPRSTGRDL